MMPPVYSVLSGDSDVAALVGTRIYPHGEAPQNTGKPYVTFQTIVGVPQNELSDVPDIDAWTMQINCFSAAPAEAADLAEAVRNAVEPYGHVTAVPIDQRDDATRLYWIALQMDWWHHRA